MAKIVKIRANSYYAFLIKRRKDLRSKRAIEAREIRVINKQISEIESRKKASVHK